MAAGAPDQLLCTHSDDSDFGSVACSPSVTVAKLFLQSLRRQLRSRSERAGRDPGETDVVVQTRAGGVWPCIWPAHGKHGTAGR